MSFLPYLVAAWLFLIGMWGVEMGQTNRCFYTEFARWSRQQSNSFETCGVRRVIKCGATGLINSRGVMTLVFFQNLGKCF